MSQLIPLFFEKLISKTFRPVLRERAQSKRISQGFFSNMCISFQNETNSKKVIYIQSNILNSSFSFISENNPLVVFAGSSDHDISVREYEQMLSLAHIKFYTQNLNFPETQSVRVLPIGVEDPNWVRNGMSWNFRRSLLEETKTNRVLVGPFGPTHGDRGSLMEIATTLRHADVVQKRLPSWTYSKLASKYRFIACPRGNGLDTHRFWETLYRGSIPIVLGTHWSSNLRNHGVPLIELQNWEELGEISLETMCLPESNKISFIDTKWWEKQLWMDLSLG